MVSKADLMSSYPPASPLHVFCAILAWKEKLGEAIDVGILFCCWYRMGIEVAL